MADKENLAALLMMQFGLAVDLVDQRASRVDGGILRLWHL